MEINEDIAKQYPKEVYNKALSIFIETNNPLIHKLIQSTPKERFQIIHKLKGGASMLGLVQITSILDVAESEPENDEVVEKIPQLFEEVISYYHKI